jgi:hypothetical protein
MSIVTNTFLLIIKLEHFRKIEMFILLILENKMNMMKLLENVLNIKKTITIYIKNRFLETKEYIQLNTLYRS